MDSRERAIRARRAKMRKKRKRQMRRRRCTFFLVLLALVLVVLKWTGVWGNRPKDAMMVHTPAVHTLKQEVTVSKRHLDEEKASQAYQQLSTEILESGLTAQGALLMKENEVLYAKNADQVMYPASMTKLLTALVAFEYGDPETMVNIQDMTGASCYSPGSMLAYFQQGDQIRLRDLIGVMMVYSANDAASAIAIHVGGSEARFAEMANAYAKELGAVNTHFTNPNGLHDDNHYTCAQDMMLFLKQAVAHEELLAIMQTKEYYCEMTRNGSYYAYSYPTTSRYLNGENSIEGFQYVAGKTGYTGPAGRCFASCFEKDGEYYYSVVMKSEDYVPATSLLYYYGSEPTAMWKILE